MQRSERDIEFLGWRRLAKEGAYDLESYRNVLRSMPEEDFRTLLEAEHHKKRMEDEALAEQYRSFSLPEFKAKVSHWSKVAHWTLDEAIALSFGKDPRQVNWKTVEEYVGESSFADSYAELRDLVMRAKEGGELHASVRPTSFIAWAKQNDIQFAPELEAAVLARATNQVDIHKQLAAERKEHEACKAQLLHALQQLAQMKAGEQKDLLPKEWNSLLKLVTVMAVVAYKYKPGAARGDVPQEIVKDAESIGVQINHGTVLKWLRKAIESVEYIIKE